MNKVLIALTASLLTVGAYAADDTNKARADVKVEARDANVKGEVAHGEVDPLAMKAQAKLSKEEMVALRSMIKAEANTTNKKALKDHQFSRRCAVLRRPPTPGSSSKNATGPGMRSRS